MGLIAFPSFVIKSIFNEALGGAKKGKKERRREKIQIYWKQPSIIHMHKFKTKEA